VILHRLEAELDEFWSCVGKKTNRHWVWIAMDGATCQILAFHVGDRSGQSAQMLWEMIPTVYQEQARFYTDQYAVHTGIIPPARRHAITKLARKTYHSERFTCTVRHRVSRLVRATLSFSKNLAHHIEAITYIICDDNLTRSAASPG